MGLRGPLPRKEEHVIDPPEQPATPKWLGAAAKRIFRDLVADLMAARVPVKRVDGHAIAMAAYCLHQTQYWAEAQEQANVGEHRQQCAALVARFQRDAQEWLNVVGGTPKSRAQMGLKGAKPMQAAGPMAVIQLRRSR
jgi:phage terminase small subunit